MNNIRIGMRFGGLATGLDTETIVRDLVRVERMRVDRLTQNRTQLQWRREDMRTLSAQLTTLRSRTFAMTLQGTYRRFTAASSNERAVVATPTSGASAMRFEFSAITRLATSASATSSGSIVNAPHVGIDANAPLAQLISEGKIEDAGLPNTYTVTLFNHTQAGVRMEETFTINTATDSLNSVLSRINASPTLGLQAFYDEFSGRVSLTSRFTGNSSATGADMGFEGAGATLFTTTLRLAATDGDNAQFTLNGLTTERRSNTFTVNGVTFNLRNTLAVGETATVTVGADHAAVVTDIQEWVRLYNDTMQQFNTQLTAERHRDYLPLTDEQKREMSEDEVKLWQERARSGLLRGDDQLERIVNRMRRDFNDPVAGTTLRQMAVIGLRTGHHSEGGRLHLDTNTLRTELERNPTAVHELFVGVADRLHTSLDTGVRELAVQAGTALSFSGVDNSVMGQRMQRINERIVRENDRIARVEDRLWRQFTSLERAMERMNSQSAWLAQQFSPRQQ